MKRRYFIKKIFFNSILIILFEIEYSEDILRIFQVLFLMMYSHKMEFIGMDRCSDTNFLLIRSWTRHTGGPRQLQQIHQQCLQRRSDRLLGQLVHQYVRRLRDILGSRFYGARAAKTSRRSGRFRPRIGLFGLSVGSSSITGCTTLVMPILLHVVAHWTRFSVLHNGRLRHSYGIFLKSMAILFFILNFSHLSSNSQ